MTTNQHKNAPKVHTSHITAAPATIVTQICCSTSKRSNRDDANCHCRWDSMERPRDGWVRSSSKEKWHKFEAYCEVQVEKKEKRRKKTTQTARNRQYSKWVLYIITLLAVWISLDTKTKNLLYAENDYNGFDILRWNLAVITAQRARHAKKPFFDKRDSLVMVDFFMQFLLLVAFIMVGTIDHQNRADPSQYAHPQSCRLNNICWEQRGIHTWRRKDWFQPMEKICYTQIFYVHCLCTDDR